MYGLFSCTDVMIDLNFLQRIGVWSYINPKGAPGGWRGSGRIDRLRDHYLTVRQAMNAAPWARGIINTNNKSYVNYRRREFDQIA